MGQKLSEEKSVFSSGWEDAVQMLPVPRRPPNPPAFGNQLVGWTPTEPRLLPMAPPAPVPCSAAWTQVTVDPVDKGQRTNGPSVLSTGGTEGAQGTRPPPANLTAEGLRQRDAKLLSQCSAPYHVQPSENFPSAQDPGQSLAFHLPLFNSCSSNRIIDGAWSGQ